MPVVTTTVREVPTVHGPARLHRLGGSRGGLPTVVLGHGAGGGIEAADLQAVAAAAVGAGCGCVLVEQPWRVAGRRIAPRPAVLDEAWLEVLGALRLRSPLVVGGRSAGARVACRTARRAGAVGVLALAFPLHPPGRPDRSRAGELMGVRLPRLVVQGSRDAFGSAAEVVAATRGVRVVEVPGADHSLARAPLDAAMGAVVDFLARLRE